MVMEKIKAWITKYALTTGILEVDGIVRQRSTLEYRRSEDHWTDYANGKDWHRSKSLALARARTMRDRRIEALKRKITALEAMKFEE
jgi:hypothetical protein